MKNQDIVIRDPFVLPVAETGTYYLYGTTARNQANGYPELGFYSYRSADLKEWEGPTPAFLPAADFWGTQDFWAPEVHRYNGAYYMFATFKAPGRCRGTQILRSDYPDGPFLPLTSGPVTPTDWECLDGTLFVDDSGAPWIVFCHEWLQIVDGSIEAMPLTDDLSRAAGEPRTLFHASDAPWARPLRDQRSYVTDGPFLFREEGKLCMLWSSFGAEGYAMGIAESESGLVTGQWRQRPQPFFAKDGGHGMRFKTFDGRLLCTIHQPNTPDEHPVFLEV